MREGGRENVMGRATIVQSETARLSMPSGQKRSSDSPETRVPGLTLNNGHRTTGPGCPGFVPEAALGLLASGPRNLRSLTGALI